MGEDKAAKEELVSASDTERNWPGVLIALLVICVVLSLILISTLVLTPGDREPRVTKTRIPQSANWRWRNNATWTPDNQIVFRNKLGGITVYNPETDSLAEIINSSPFRQLNAQDFLLSADSKFVIFISNIKQVYKYTKEATYHIYELSSKVRYPVSEKYIEAQSSAPYLQTLRFGPVGSAYAFVSRNHLFYCGSGKERQAVKLSVSDADWVYNGYPDWIYQSEIIKSDEAFWFSTDGNFLAFAVFNDTDVGRVPFTKYGDQDPYPKSIQVPYPRPGTPNPTVSLWVVSLQDGYNKTLVPKPKQLANDNSYLAGVRWTDDDELVTVWVNRRQNVTAYSLCNVAPGAFIECSVEAVIRVDGKPADLRPRLKEPITRELSELFAGVPSLYKSLFKDTQGWIYYEASPEHKPTQRHLYCVGDDINLTQFETCVTCPTLYGNSTVSDVAVMSNTSVDGNPSSYPVKSTDCLYTKTTFSPNKRYYMIECLGPDVPSVHVFDTSNDTKIRTLDSNAALRQKYNSYAIPQIKLFPVELEDGGHAQVKLQLPPGLREYEDMIFPLVLKVSGTPGEPSVSHIWSVDYSSYLASKHNYIIAEIDAGDDVGSKAALRLISVVEYLKDNLKFIDTKRIAVYGEGFGGYMAAMILSLDTEMFQCGISINGIFSWPHYNSVWTERWLHTANITDNYRGYEDADITKKVGNLKDKKFLLLDSTYDFEVHYQHAMLMVRALVQADLIFKHLSYPDEGHGLVDVQNHLHRMMDQFWTDCFGELDFEEWESGTNAFAFKS
ncbi:Prolyl oligopeptidase family [Nesidiocoris tenuis]|uniref:Prolyl oligopeptidase family n=1 Tax=Nesidiocoris tenuis TaxID=355587 RepID=A0ABN7BDI2_9HEMI|nr:Prolyl oligopeptidase family [Nesidiocoris tenuis]